MPLSVGKSWTYEVRGRQLTQVGTMEVSRKLSVAGVEGYELNGPTGLSRLAWSHGRLLASEMAGTYYRPAIVILDPSCPPGAIGWVGDIVGPAGTISASALLFNKAVQWPWGGRSVAAIETTLQIDADRRHVAVVSHYVDGVGLVGQDQRTNGLQDVALEMTAGP